MATKVPVFVPYRSDNGTRAENWTYIQSCQWDLISWADIHLGESPEGPFNISAARNDAARKVENWDVAVFADADSFVDHYDLETAIAVARKTKQVVLPHSRWVNVRQDEVHQLLVEGYLTFDPKRTVVGGTKGSLYVIPREAYEAVNGFDERFRGWGWEDTAFHLTVETLYKPIIQFEGNLWHLEHERPDADTNRGTNEDAIRNRQHYNSYKRARSGTELQKLINGNRVKL